MRQASRPIAEPPPTTGTGFVSASAERMGTSAIRDLLRLTERPEVISLAGGLPSPAAFPLDALRAAAVEALDDDPIGALQYGPTEGYRPLREWIAGHRSIPGADGVLVTTGSQQALDLVARAFVEPGDVVAVADPAYIGALQAWRSAGARVLAIPADGDGLDVAHLAERLAAGVRPRLVYTVSDFHNPTGATLSPERRGALAGFAERYGFVIVDDDPYGELRWAGERPAALRHLTDRVITLGSFSKILAPGLRVGYAVADEVLVRPLAIVKQAADLHTAGLNQRIVHRVVGTEGFLPAHLAGLRLAYRTRAEALTSALAEHLGERFSAAMPDGGLFLWGALRGVADTAALLPCAIEHGVAFVPGAAFAVVGGPRATLRLSFATVDPDEADEAARRLARAVSSTSWRTTEHHS